MRRWRQVGDTEEWLYLSQTTQLQMLSHAPGTYLSPLELPPIPSQIRRKQRGQQRPSAPWEEWHPRGLPEATTVTDAAHPPSPPKGQSFRVR